MTELELNKEEIDQESLIDHIYRRFVRGISRAIGSTEFYEFFMDSISGARNEFQFSNRRVVKSIDLKWVEAIEEALDAMQNIIASPRNIIKEEELIVNVAHAKRAGAETVRHLAMHSSLVEDFNENSGDVRPSKLMQRYREDSTALYENRLVFTTMEYAHHFVKVRYDALLEEMGDEFGAKLKVKSDMASATEQVHLDMFLHIKNMDSALETDAKNEDALSRISRIYRVLTTFMNSEFAQQMSKLPRTKGTVNKTNVLKKNPNYKQILKLWDFLKLYDEVGYTIRIVEQNPEINQRFQEDIYRNILFNYLILKGYLEDESSRRIPQPKREKEKVLKPKIIHQIIEELTEDYDLTDVEVRKVLIEELTKEQLMHEEAMERLRMVEEQQGKKDEEERQRKARIRQEKERLRQEKEAEELKKYEAQKLQSEEDQGYKKLFQSEVDYFKDHFTVNLERRKEKEAMWKQPKEDFAEFAGILEAEELRRQALELLQDYVKELEYFETNLIKRCKLRQKTEENYRLEIQEREKLRRERIAKKTLR